MIVAALGDSLSGGYAIDGRFVDDAGGSYPALVAQHVGATQIGIVAIVGATIEMIADNLERLPAGTDLLIVNAGTNDMVPLAAGVGTLADACAAYDEMVARSRAWMPGARIVVVGIRDVAAMDPANVTDPHWILKLRTPEKVHAAALAFNEHVLALPGTIPVDLARRAGSDSVALFPDAIHPSPLGVRWIADAVLEALPKPM